RAREERRDMESLSFVVILAYARIHVESKMDSGVRQNDVLVFQPQHVERRHGPVKTLERELADRLGLHEVFDAAEHALRHERLSAFRFRAEARRKIAHRADRAVVEAAFEA